MTTSLIKKRSWPGKVAATAALAFVLTTAIAGPALADRDYDHDRYRRHGYYNDRDWRWHERHARDYYIVHPRPIPRVVYTPPIVVAPPPPSGISLFFPLNFY